MLLTKMALEREERRERENALEDDQGVLDAFGSERVSSFEFVYSLQDQTAWR